MPRIEIHGPNDVVWATGEHRLRVLTPLARTGRSTAGEVDAAARELGIERAQCYRLLRRLRADRTVTALLPGPSGRRAGVRLLNKAVEATIEKAIAHPTDSRLYERARHSLVTLAGKAGIALRQTYNRLAPRLAGQVGRYAHAR